MYKQNNNYSTACNLHKQKSQEKISLKKSDCFLKQAILIIAFFIAWLLPMKMKAQANFGGRTPITLNIVTDFGANPNDSLDDTWSFIKAYRYMENKWSMAGVPYATPTVNINYSTHYVVLEIPASTNGNGFQVGRSFLIYNNPIGGIDYSFTDSCSAGYPSVNIPYKDLFAPGVVDTGNHLTLPIAVTMKKDTCANNTIHKFCTAYTAYIQIFNLSNEGVATNKADGIKIKGIPYGNVVPKIKYNDSLAVGFTDAMGNNLTPSGPNDTLSGYMGAYLFSLNNPGGSHLFRFVGVNNIEFDSLEIDGNSPKVLFKGLSNVSDIQNAAIGIYFDESKNISINDCYIHHMTMDGWYLSDDDITTAATNLVAKNIRSEFNMRGAFTWIAGDSASFENCSFSYTGKDSNIYQAGFMIRSNPSCGIDFEPDHSGQQCRHGIFVNCEFIDNSGLALGARSSPSFSDSISAMRFDTCTFWKGTGVGINCHGDDFTYNYCNMWCPVIYGGYGINANSEHKYNYCNFEDKPHPVTGALWQYNIDTKFLFFTDFGTSGKSAFKNCKFKVNEKNRNHLWINKDYNNVNYTKDQYTVFEDCDFLYNNDGSTGTNPSVINGAIFRGESRFENILNATNSYHLVKTRKLILEGSSQACNPNTLTIKGQVEHYMESNTIGVSKDTFQIGSQSNGADGFAVYELDKDALGYLEDSTRIKIGILSAVRTLPKGSVIINGTILFGGQMTHDAGSYLVSKPWINHFISDTSNKSDLLYIDKFVNYNSTTTSPIWTTGQGYATGGQSILPFQGGWLNTVTPFVTPCMQGNHASLGANLFCSPQYTHILTQGAKTMLYNLQVPCAGSANADMQFTVMGGVRPFVYIFNGDTIPDSNLVNIPIGIDTIIITDATLCTDTFYVSADTVLTYKIVKGCVSGTPGVFTTNACTEPTVTGPGGAFISYSNDTVSVSAAGIYTITDTASGKTAKVYIGACTDCTTAPDTAEWKLADTTTTTLFPDGVVPLNNIVLQGAIDIDSLLIFNNQPDIYCTANTQLTLTDSNTFICTRTKMRGCTEYWKGIKADGYGKSVIINNFSMMQDMDEGVHIKNNAFLQATRSTYLNNLGAGIVFENIKEPAYRSAVTENTFRSDTSIFANAGSTPCAGREGIYVHNSTDIEIGDSSDATKGNLFRDMQNGIFITGDNNIGNVLTSNESRIGIYNNHFANMQNCTLTGIAIDYQKVSGCYNTFLGAGVIANFGMAPAMFDAHIDVRNTNDTNTVFRFDSCDKAIVAKNASVTAKNLYLSNNLLGIMCNGTTGKTMNIEHNTMRDALTSIQLIGDNGYSSIRENDIVTRRTGVTSPIWYGMWWPSGIHINNFVKTDTSTVTIEDNAIEVTSVAGMGISLYNTGRNVIVKSNDIDLTEESTTGVGGAVIIMLTGIYGANIKDSKIIDNHIDGNDSINVAERENVHGIQLNNTEGQTLQCNMVSKTRFGIGAISNCKTDSLNGMVGNILYNQVLGWTFRHLGDEGSIGNVGNASNDNNNRFLGNGYIYKVFKFCEGNLPYQIFTDTSKLKLSESASYDVITTMDDCPYLVQLNPGATVYTCPVNYNFLQASSSGFSHAEAISIITNTKSYSEYPEISHWMDERKLYKQLEGDSTFRVSNDTLENFYTTMLDDIIAQIESTEDRLALLIASMESQNYDLYMERMALAEASNSNIVSDEDQEENEAHINAIYLRMLEYGLDTLDNTDSTFIYELAVQCPYIGGTAVYKARALQAMYEPAMVYDDISICNTIGVYKNGGNGKGIFDDENAYLKSLKPKEINPLIVFDDFMIYPNPTSTNINIKYNLQKPQRGSVIIYDLLGRERMKIDLVSDVNHVSVNINSLETGVYVYKYSVDNKTTHAGKLLKE